MRFLDVSKFDYSRRITPDESYSLTDIRFIPLHYAYIPGTPYILPEGEELDRTAVKVFGKGNEYMWYKIADANARKIVAWKADFNKIRKLKL